MNDKLICPFCGQKLHKDPDGYYTCYTDNCGCWANGGNGASGSESLWQVLIGTKKKLDICVKALNKIANTDIKIIEKESRYYARAMFSVTNNALGRIQDIEQINNKEQK